MSAPIELPDVKTLIVPLDAADALVLAWRELFGETPKLSSVFVLLAQEALETGWWKACHCFNLGNAKSREGDGHDWTFFECGENLSRALAERIVAESGGLVTIKRYYDGGKSAEIKIKPKHPYCRFRAFRTLREGMIDYLGLLRRRFASAWPAVLAGDPKAFAIELSKAHYYTAPVEQYTSDLVSIFLHFGAKLPAGWTPDSVGEEDDEAQAELGITAEDRKRIAGLVALTAKRMSDELFAPSQPDDVS